MPSGFRLWYYCQIKNNVKTLKRFWPTFNLGFFQSFLCLFQSTKDYIIVIMEGFNSVSVLSDQTDNTYRFCGRQTPCLPQSNYLKTNSLQHHRCFFPYILIMMPIIQKRIFNLLHIYCVKIRFWKNACPPLEGTHLQVFGCFYYRLYCTRLADSPQVWYFEKWKITKRSHFVERLWMWTTYKEFWIPAFAGMTYI